MSRVPSSQRKTSEVEFIITAEKIHERVIKSVYNDFGVKTDNPRLYWLIQNNKTLLKACVDHLVNYIYAANSIYPACKEEVIALREQARADVNKYEQLIADFNNTEEPVEG